jgi:hypothetical protein
MKKITLILAFVAMTIGASAQMKFGFGARYGIGLNSVSTSPSSDDNKTSISAINAALLAELGFHKNFAVQPELFFQQNGFKYEVGSVSTTAKMNYLGLNILPKAKFGNEKIEGFVMAGLGFGLKMSASMDGVVFTENVQSLNMSLIFGGGAAYKLTSGKIFIDGRYNLGMSNATKAGGELKTNQIGINVGYIHNIGK